MSDQHLPLHGIRVLELGHIVAGPSAGFILAELGADVIKIENPDQGDAARNMMNQGSSFYFLNRNKRSLSVNLKTERGAEIFRKLVMTTDVVVDNYGPGSLEKLGIHYPWAQATNPRIIYCSIKGFLPGPNEKEPYLDELAQMAGGLAHMTGLSGRPMRAGASIIDIGAATYGVVGVLAALYRREQTGHGEEIKAGLYETCVFLVGQHVVRTQLTGRVPDPMTVSSMGGQMGWGVYQLFPTLDGRQVFIAVTSNRHWAQFCKEFGLDDLLVDDSLNNNTKRVGQRDRIAERISQVTQALPFLELCDRLRLVAVPYAPLNTPRDLLEDPHLMDGNRLLAVDVPEMTGLRIPTLPITVGETKFAVQQPPPQLGEHTDSLLQELGYAADEIIAMKSEGTVRTDGGMLQIQPLAEVKKAR